MSLGGNGDEPAGRVPGKAGTVEQTPHLQDFLSHGSWKAFRADLEHGTGSAAETPVFAGLFRCSRCSGISDPTQAELFAAVCRDDLRGR